MAGDPSPETHLRIPADCTEALETYKYLFREGPERAAADVMVGVTEYQAYVPAKPPAVKVNIKGCAYDRRTIVLTYGQRIDVANLDDTNSYLPFLVGDSSPVHMAMAPHSDPVKLSPVTYGRFLLNDEMRRPWMTADVFVLKYATHAVTGLDGRYKIEGIPVGQVRVSAYLVAADLTTDKVITIEADKPTVVDFTLTYTQPPAKPSKSAPKPRSSAPR